MRAPLATLWLAAGAASACGGPLDRVDGALVIRMAGVPAAVDTVQVEVRAGGRAFPLVRARPRDDVVRDYSAVPVGRAGVDLVLRDGDDVVVAREGLTVEIAEGETAELPVAFDAGPALDLAARAAGDAHPVWAGPIFVDVRDLSEAPPAEARVEAWANGEPVAVPPFTDGTWILEVDPRRAGPVLPAPLEIRVRACFDGLAEACTDRALTIDVHRRAGRADLGGKVSAAPLALDDLGWVVVGTEAGALHVLDAADGAPVQDSLPLTESALGAPARIDDVVAVADRAGAVHAFTVGPGGLEPAWTRRFDRRSPSPVVAGPARFVVADQAEVLALAPEDGAPTSVVRMAAPVAAAPLADEAGVVVADLSGRVVALDAADAPRFTAELGERVYAAPARDGDGVRVADQAGRLFALGPDGAPRGPPVELGEPVLFAPVPVDGAWAVASARTLHWVEGGRAAPLALGERVIGAPTLAHRPDRVALGLFNGRIVIATRGRAQTVTRLGAVAGSPALGVGPEDGAPRVFVGDSTGDFQVLRLEEGF